MGQEARCAATWRGQASQGKALLESDSLVFRGDFRLAIPFKEVTGLEARRGRLTVRFPGGPAEFELGPLAEKWALKIRYPKKLIDKLGVKPGSRVSVLGISDENFWAELRERTGEISERPARQSDFVFLGAAKKGDLKKLQRMESLIARDGAVWVVWPKGQKRITEADVIAASKQAGLVDTKVASFSETHSALKLVIPAHRR